MAKKFKNLQMQTLARHIAEIRICDRPSDGWLGAIRKSLGMSVQTLADRMNISQQSVSKFEKNEVEDSITITSLRKAAEAMECKLVYAIIPVTGGLEDIVKKQAFRKASEIVNPVSHSMMLEAQEVGNKKEKIAELADEMVKNLKSDLWK